jgi:hypothetical protein
MIKDWSRFRSCMVKIMDQYYFKELPKAELDRQIANTVVRDDSVKNMEDLSEFMERHQNICMPDNELQWKVWLVPDFNET